MLDADAALKAGQLLEELPRLWRRADLSERRRILMTMLSAVYADTVEEKRIVAIRPKPAFRALFEIATTREGSGVVLVSEQLDQSGQSAETPPTLALVGKALTGICVSGGTGEGRTPRLATVQVRMRTAERPCYLRLVLRRRCSTIDTDMGKLVPIASRISPHRGRGEHSLSPPG